MDAWSLKIQKFINFNSGWGGTNPDSSNAQLGSSLGITTPAQRSGGSHGGSPLAQLCLCANCALFWIVKAQSLITHLHPSNVLYLWLTSNNILKLQLVQNVAAFIALQAPKVAHVTSLT